MTFDLASLDFVYLSLLLVWQSVFIWAIIRRLPLVGFVSLAGLVLALGSLMWAGLPALTALALTVVVSIFISAPTFLSAPLRFRSAVGLFHVTGLTVTVSLWASHGMTQWRLLVVAAGFAAAVGAGIYLLLGFDRTARSDRPVDRSGIRPLMKYLYFSQRAIDALYRDNGESTRFRLALSELRIPSLGGVTPEATVTLPKRKISRNETALNAEKLLAGRIDLDPGPVLASGSGLLRGRGEVYATLYGTEKLEDKSIAGRVAFFTMTGEGQRTALCLFGSRDNLDGWLQDSHPEPVTGWAFSSTSDVIRWLNDGNAEWEEGRWGESIGLEALKMANYQAILGLGGFFGTRRGYALSLAGRYQDADWLALIYHTESVQRDDLPFDTVMIGRPFWIRSEHLLVQNTDEFSLEMMKSGGKDARLTRRWKKLLRPTEAEPGWPLYLYKSLCRIRRISS